MTDRTEPPEGYRIRQGNDERWWFLPPGEFFPDDPFPTCAAAIAAAWTHHDAQEISHDGE